MTFFNLILPVIIAAALGEHIRHSFDTLLLPGTPLCRQHTVPRRNLLDRAILAQRLKRHFCLEVVSELSSLSPHADIPSSFGIYLSSLFSFLGTAQGAAIQLLPNPMCTNYILINDTVALGFFFSNIAASALCIFRVQISPKSNEPVSSAPKLLTSRSAGALSYRICA